MRNKGNKQGLRAEEPLFYTPEWFAEKPQAKSESPHGKLLIASCQSGTYLANKVVGIYRQKLREAGSEGQVEFLEDIDFQFSDSEAGVRLSSDVSGKDVYLFQALFDAQSNSNINHNLMAFLIAVRAFREWGANRVTGILPYLAYARQEKPTKFKREPTTAKLVAELCIAAGIDRLVTWNPHYGSIHGFFGKVPVDALEPLKMFVSLFKQFESREDVIAVAPDAGASKFVTHFSRRLNLNSAVASKHRPSHDKAVVSEVIGNFSGKRIAILVDDMISTGGTIYSLTQKLVAETDIEQIFVCVSHNLCLPIALERFTELNRGGYLSKLFVTNSIPQSDNFQAQSFLAVQDLSESFTNVINRIHYNQAVADLFKI